MRNKYHDVNAASERFTNCSSFALARMVAWWAGYSRSLRLGIAGLMFTLVASGCSSSTHYSGFVPPTDPNISIETGMTIAEITETLGEPTISRKIPELGYYYISSEVIITATRSSTESRRAVLAIYFDDQQRVASWKLLSKADGIDVEPSDREIRGLGQSTTFFDQFFSRITAFTPSGTSQ